MSSTTKTTCDRCGRDKTTKDRYVPKRWKSVWFGDAEHIMFCPICLADVVAFARTRVEPSGLTCEGCGDACDLSIGKSTGGLWLCDPCCLARNTVDGWEPRALEHERPRAVWNGAHPVNDEAKRVWGMMSENEREELRYTYGTPLDSPRIEPAIDPEKL